MTSEPFDPDRALMFAYQGLKTDDQVKFWRGRTKKSSISAGG